MPLVNRRIGLLFAIFLFLLIGALGRAAWLGGVKADELGSRAASQQEAELVIPARRGTIFDRDGKELAVSEDAITVFANPFLIADPEDAAVQLAPHVGLSAPEVQAKLTEPGRGFVYVARRLPPDQGSAVEKLEIEGIETLVEARRVYPQGDLAGQLLGSVGVDGFGLAGIEQSQEELLHGSEGRQSVVKDALGKAISIEEHEAAVPGQDIELTIDTPIQAWTEEVLAGVGEKYSPTGATALVMNPANGEILAMANWPAVDPEVFGEASEYDRQNRTVAASYEPGSTFKAITVAGALEESLVKPATMFDLPPVIQVADREIGESHDRGTVSLSVAQILAQSSNVGAVKIGLLLGAERFDAWVREFGFGAGTGIDVPGEASGITLDPKDYSGSTMGNLPLGQGLAVTQVQLAAAYAAIANGGVMATPHVIAGSAPESRRVVSGQTAKRVAKMLEGVLAVGGTASEASIDGYRIAGKTGTAEKPDGYGGYSDTAFVGSFVGFAPARKPELLVAIAVDEPQGSYYGGEVAAPAFEKIVEFALPYLQIAPD